MTSVFCITLPEQSTKEKKTSSVFPVDFYEDEAGYTIEASFPGYPKNSVSVKTENGLITITAKMREKKDGLVYSEAGIQGDQERTWRISNIIDSELITASFKDGLLSVTLPKMESKKLKDIKIK